MSDRCLFKAEPGDIAVCCFREAFDRMLYPTIAETSIQRSFPIVYMAHKYPVIGLLRGSKERFALSNMIEKYNKEYSHQYILFPYDIKTIKIIKKKK